MEGSGSQGGDSSCLDECRAASKPHVQTHMRKRLQHTWAFDCLPFFWLKKNPFRPLLLFVLPFCASLISLSDSIPQSCSTPPYSFFVSS